MGASLRLRGAPRPDPLEETIGRLYRAASHDVAGVVSALAAEQRARLALFCYNRAHMREIGVAVAATCDLGTLVEVGAAVGHALFALSRERPQPEAKRLGGRQQITLAKFTGNPAHVADVEPEVDTGNAVA